MKTHASSDRSRQNRTHQLIFKKLKEMYQSEKKTIKLSMVVLFLSLMIIYVILFHLKGDRLKITLGQNTNQPTNEQLIPKIIIPDIAKIENKITTLPKAEKIQNTGINITGNNYGFTKPKTGNQQTIGYTKTLSGTQRYYGPLESIERLGINYDFALKDDKDIYYITLDQEYDFAKIARELEGNLYIINTEKEILENKLFGEKITFINIPEYKDKLVIMIIEIDETQRLIQVSYAIYHQSKSHIQKVFNQ